MRVRVTKVSDNPGEMQSHGEAINEGYWVEGELWQLETGKPLVVKRDIRNGVKAEGWFTTTPLQRVVRYSTRGHETLRAITTQSGSIYHVEILEPVKETET